jgi:hypothetical protein
VVEEADCHFISGHQIHFISTWAATDDLHGFATIIEWSSFHQSSIRWKAPCWLIVNEPVVLRDAA